MKHRYTAKIVIRKDSIKEDGTAPLYLQVFISGRRKKIPLWLYVQLKNFNPKKMTVKGPDADKINAVLFKMMAKTKTIFHTAMVQDQVLSLERFVDYFERRDLMHDFLVFVEHEMKLALSLIHI